MARTYDLYWSPAGRKIATVTADNSKAAIRKAPKPYRKYLGEIYAVEQVSEQPAVFIRTPDGVLREKD